MKTTQVRPSHFIGNYAMDSVFQKAEHEQIFMNMLVISKRLGDSWGLTKEQYEAERKKDGAYSSLESKYADEVLPYLQSAKALQIHGMAI